MAHSHNTVLGIKALSEFFGMFFFAYTLAASKYYLVRNHSNDNFTENIVMGSVIMIAM
jgi:hypothetical protein